jgi:hypothetical protein
MTYGPMTNYMAMSRQGVFLIYPGLHLRKVPLCTLNIRSLILAAISWAWFTPSYRIILAYPLATKVPADHGVKVEGTRDVLPEEFVASDFDVMVLSMNVRLVWCRENLGP